jgi:hypothetical protein
MLFGGYFGAIVTAPRFTRCADGGLQVPAMIHASDGAVLVSAGGLAAYLHFPAFGVSQPKIGRLTH